MNTESLRERDAVISDLTAECKSLRQQLAAVTKDRDDARAERDAKQKTIEFSCRDWADDDTRVKAIAAQFGIKECHENHDAFKGVIEITEEMAERLKSAESARDKLAQAILDAPHDPNCAAVGFGHVFPCDCWKASETKGSE